MASQTSSPSSRQAATPQTTAIRVTVTQTDDATSEASIRHHRLLVDRPSAKGGHDAGPMGGEVLLAALGGCFMSTLLAAVKAREAEFGTLSASVTGTLAGSPSRFERIRLELSAEGSQPEGSGGGALTDEGRSSLERLALMAERACIVANTLRGSVTLEFAVV